MHTMWVIASSMEDITYIVNSCPKISTKRYLLLKHDSNAKAIYNARHMQDCQEIEMYIKDRSSQLLFTPVKTRNIREALQ